MDTAISLRNLVKVFDGHRAVDGLSFDVPRGHVFGLLGRNGAGKTTTIRMIMDIIRPDTGEVFVLGSPIDSNIKDRIGYLPEERGLYPKMKLLDMLEFQGAVKGLAPAEARKRAAGWLDRLGLGERKEGKVEELSKGMQQKAQLIAAILSRPELLILDEPFSGLDPVNQDVFKDLIMDLNRGGTTVIFSTHVMDSAEKLCEEIVLINRGKVVLAGKLAAIKRQFGQNTVVMELDGDAGFLSALPAVEHVADYRQHLEVRLRPDGDPQELLEAAVGRVRVRRFEVMAPTLHNIFVQQVGDGQEAV